MKKIFLAAVLAILVSAVFLTGCTTGEAACTKEIVVVGEDEELVKELMKGELAKIEAGEDEALAGQAISKKFTKLSITGIVSGGSGGSSGSCDTVWPSGCTDFSCIKIVC